MEFSELASYRPRIEATLSRQYDAWEREGGTTFRPYVRLLRGFTLRGGKRFRALLVLAGYHIATGKDPTPALPAAAALEHFQSWMLVHDDIIDHSEERRGGPTVHRALEERHRADGDLGDSASYGVGLGITLGDLEEPYTLASLLESAGDRAGRDRALAEYVRMTRKTAYGQLLDIRNGALPVAKVRESDVLRVHELKSAIYTVASPLRIGAFLGGGRVPLADDLDAIGVDLGIAFQLRDDVLGAGFDADAAGKSANDLIEGKRTLLVVRAWAKADAAGRASLGRVLGEPRSTVDQIAAAREIIRSTGSLAYSEARIAALTRRAYERIETSRHIRPARRALLREIGDRLVHRAT